MKKPLQKKITIGIHVYKLQSAMVAEIVICHNLIHIKSSLDINKFRMALLRYTAGCYLKVIGNS